VRYPCRPQNLNPKAQRRQIPQRSINAFFTKAPATEDSPKEKTPAAVPPPGEKGPLQDPVPDIVQKGSGGDDLTVLALRLLLLFYSRYRS